MSVLRPGLEYEPATDVLVINGVRFSPQLVVDFVQALREKSTIGPVFLTLNDAAERIEFRTSQIEGAQIP